MGHGRGPRHGRSPRLLLRQHGARVRVSRARRHGVARAPPRDRLLPARGAPVARAPRHPRSPRLCAVRAGRDAAGLLSGRPRLVRRAESLLDGAARGRGVAAEPRARRHARDLDHLRGERARRPLRARLFRRRPPAAGRRHGRHRVARRRGRGPRGARLRESRRGPSRDRGLGETQPARRAPRRARKRPRGARRRRRAGDPSGARHALPGPRPALDLRVALGPPSARGLRSRASRAGHGRFPPHDRRPHRARPPGPEHPGADRTTLGAQPGTRRDPEPDPRNLQRPEEEPDPRRSLPLDHLGGRQGPRFPAGRSLLYDRERNVFPRGPTSASTTVGRTFGSGTSPRRRSPATGPKGTASPSLSTSGTGRRAKPRPPSRRHARSSRPATRAGTRASSSGSPCTPATACSDASRSTTRRTARPPRSRRSDRSRSSPTRPSPRSKMPGPTARPASNPSGIR